MASFTKELIRWLLLSWPYLMHRRCRKDLNEHNSWPSLLLRWELARLGKLAASQGKKQNSWDESQGRGRLSSKVVATPALFIVSGHKSNQIWEGRWLQGQGHQWRSQRQQHGSQWLAWHRGNQNPRETILLNLGRLSSQKSFSSFSWTDKEWLLYEKQLTD